jgi:hypothetical protein
VDWLKNLGAGAVPLLEGGRKITFWEFTVAAQKIVGSLERGGNLDSEEAQYDHDMQDSESSIADTPFLT